MLYSCTHTATVGVKGLKYSALVMMMMMMIDVCAQDRRTERLYSVGWTR